MPPLNKTLTPVTGLRDEWLFRRPAIKTDLINKIITLPTFSVNCGPVKKCEVFFENDATLDSVLHTYNLSNAFTIEGWIKPQNCVATEQVIFHYANVDNSSTIRINITSLVVSAYVTVATIATTLTSTIALTLNDWSHFAFTFDGSVINLYINGVLVATDNTVSAPIDTADFFPIFAMEAATTKLFRGKMGEFRIWNVARTAEKIANYRYSPRDILGTVDVGLVGYITFRHYKTSGTFHAYDLISGTEVGGTGVVNGNVDTEDAPPIIYGASFICDSFAVDLATDYGISFQYPVLPINTEIDHSLYVSWTDSDNIFQRRCLYHASPYKEDVGGEFPDYAGEYISPQFTLEVWNVDGNATANLVDELILNLSQTTQPALGTDRVQHTAASLTGNTLLGASFPLVFPFSFDTQQTYV